MTTIPLANSDLCAVVDDEDLALVSAYTWYLNGRYAVAFPGPSESLSMHQLLLPASEGLNIDHRDRDGLNNRRENLRLATRSQNQANRVSRTGASRFKGVTASKTPGKWRATVTVDKKTRAYGTYESEEDAARAYNRVAFAAWGDYALLNDVDGWEDFPIKTTRWPSTEDRGIYWHEKAGKWNPRVFRNGRQHYFGLFTTREEAIAARRAYLEKLEGAPDGNPSNPDPD
jgi:hypothetical protein